MNRSKHSDTDVNRITDAILKRLRKSGDFLDILQVSSILNVSSKTLQRYKDLSFSTNPLNRKKYIAAKDLIVFVRNNRRRVARAHSSPSWGKNG